MTIWPPPGRLLLRVHHLQRNVLCQTKKKPLRQAGFENSVEAVILLSKTKKREPRQATLQVSWGQIQIPPPAKRKGEKLTLYLVNAIEQGCPQQEQPVEWYLLTTLAVKEQSQALLLLDYYRRRWIMERCHLVVKYGLKAERLQFDTFTRLSKAIGMLSIVAWQLLLLKQLAVHAPEMKAEGFFEPLQQQVLQEQAGKSKLTIRQSLLVVAALAGFVPSKKQPLPGKKIVWKGWHLFCCMCRGYRLASQKNYGTG